MTKLIYLAGPITGLTYGAATDWRDEVKQRLHGSSIHTLSPLRGKQYLEQRSSSDGRILDSYEEYPMSSAKGINARDHWDVKRCDAVLVNFLGTSRVSIGTVMEIAWAFAYRVPVILVIDKDNLHDHAMIRESVGFIVDSLEKGMEVLISLLCSDQELDEIRDRARAKTERVLFVSKQDDDMAKKLVKEDFEERAWQKPIDTIDDWMAKGYPPKDWANYCEKHLGKNCVQYKGEQGKPGDTEYYSKKFPQSTAYLESLLVKEPEVLNQAIMELFAKRARKLDPKDFVGEGDPQPLSTTEAYDRQAEDLLDGKPMICPIPDYIGFNGERILCQLTGRMYHKVQDRWVVESSAVGEFQEPAEVAYQEPPIFVQLPDPTEADLNDPNFNAVWEVIKTWDIAVPDAYGGYCGAMGNHAKAIIRALYRQSLSEMEEQLDRFRKGADL